MREQGPYRSEGGASSKGGARPTLPHSAAASQSSLVSPVAYHGVVQRNHQGGDDVDIEALVAEPLGDDIVVVRAPSSTESACNLSRLSSCSIRPQWRGFSLAYRLDRTTRRAWGDELAGRIDAV